MQKFFIDDDLTFYLEKYCNVDIILILFVLLGRYCELLKEYRSTFEVHYAIALEVCIFEHRGEICAHT